ncbi:MAG: DUF4350 domain-containing protein, partial [Halobacteriaceae archaeon]
MRRRSFLGTLLASSVGGPLIANSGAATINRQRRESLAASFPKLMFDSSCGLLDGDKEPLTDQSLVAVWAEDSATSTDSDGNGDAIGYGGNNIPLVVVDDNVVGIGAPILENETEFSFGNDELGLNALETIVGGGTILWDEGHDQYYTLSKFTDFATYAENHGYSFTTTTSIADDLSNADGVVITTPTASFSSSERQALADFASNGGGIFLFSQSDYRDFDATGNLNEIASELGVDFRFNDDQVMDQEHNNGPEFIPVTNAFNTDAHGSLFKNRKGISAG